MCKSTLLATLRLSEWMVNHWLEDSKEKEIDDGDLTNRPELNENTKNARNTK